MGKKINWWIGGSIQGSNYKWFRTKFANFNRKDYDRLNFEFLAQEGRYCVIFLLARLIFLIFLPSPAPDNYCTVPKLIFVEYLRFDDLVVLSGAEWWEYTLRPVRFVCLILLFINSNNIYITKKSGKPIWQGEALRNWLSVSVIVNI